MTQPVGAPNSARDGQVGSQGGGLLSSHWGGPPKLLSPWSCCWSCRPEGKKRLGWASQPHGGHKPHCKHNENTRAFSVNFQEALRSLSWQLGSLSEGARRTQTPQLPFGVPRTPAPKPWVSSGTRAPELTLREEPEGPHWPAFCPLGLHLLGPIPAHRHTSCPLSSLHALRAKTLHAGQRPG